MGVSGPHSKKQTKYKRQKVCFGGCGDKHANWGLGDCGTWDMGKEVGTCCSLSFLVPHHLKMTTCWNFEWRKMTNCKKNRFATHIWKEKKTKWGNSNRKENKKKNIKDRCMCTDVDQWMWIKIILVVFSLLQKCPFWP